MSIANPWSLLFPFAVRSVRPIFERFALAHRTLAIWAIVRASNLADTIALNANVERRLPQYEFVRER